MNQNQIDFLFWISEFKHFDHMGRFEEVMSILESLGG